MKFFARRLPKPMRKWVLENARGFRMYSVGYHWTYGELLDAACALGFSSLDIELKYQPPRGETALAREIEDAMWAGDVELLDELAHCRCCCHEHTFGPGCPAYAWGGCRGQGTMTREDHESWARHYERFHGMTRDQFYGWDEP